MSDERRPALADDQVEDLERQIVRWRTLALTSWADAVAAARYEETGAQVRDEAGRARAELAALKHTLSWRLTVPLRSARHVVSRLRGRA